MINGWAKQLIITVSVEPDDPCVTGQIASYRSLMGLDRFHNLCKRFAVKPTYFLTYSAAGETLEFVIR